MHICKTQACARQKYACKYIDKGNSTPYISYRDTKYYTGVCFTDVHPLLACTSCRHAHLADMYSVALAGMHLFAPRADVYLLEACISRKLVSLVGTHLLQECTSCRCVSLAGSHLLQECTSCKCVSLAGIHLLPACTSCRHASIYSPN